MSECKHGRRARSCPECDLMADLVEACHGWALAEERAKMLLAYKNAYDILWRREGDCELCSGDADGPTSDVVRVANADDVWESERWIHLPREDAPPGDEAEPCPNSTIHEALYEARAYLAGRGGR